MFINRIFHKKYIAYVCYVLMWFNIISSDGVYSYELSSEAEKYGSVTKKYISQEKNNGRVIHIKDVHCNPEIQMNIARILNIVCADNEINIIGIEGASGKIDTSLFQVFPDKEVKQDVCGNFVEKGFLSGSEYFSICDNYSSPVSLWGLENTQLYKDNLRQFRETKSLPANILDDISLIESELMSLKKELYPSLLYDFEVACEEYTENLIDINAWISIISDYAEWAGINLENYRSIVNYNELNSESSSLSFSKVNQELDLLYGEKSGLLSESQQLVLKKLIFDFRIGKITLNTLMNSFNEIDSINFDVYPSLKIAKRIAELEESSNTDTLSTELERLKKNIRESALKPLKDSDNSRHTDCLDIGSLCTHVRLISKLCSLSLSYTEWEKYNQKRNYSITSIIQRLKLIGDKYGIPLNYIASFRFSPEYSRIISSAEEFYINADKRSIVMADRLIKKMDDTGSSSAVIVTGGYHSKAIEQYLEQNGISYLTIQPNASKSVSDELYFSLMMQDSIYNSGGTSVDNIAFPIVCENDLSESYFFYDLRRQLAKQLLSHKNSELSIFEFKAKLIHLNDPNMWATFNNLLFIAGVDISQTGTIDDLISSIDPEKVAAHIARFDDYTIEQLSNKWETEQDGMNYQYNVLYAHHLILILELAVYLKNPETDLSEYLKTVIENTRHPEYNFIHTAAQQRDYEINSVNISFLEKVKQENFSVFKHGETATQYEVFINDDRTVFLKVKRKFIDTLRIRVPQIFNNFRLFFGDVIVFYALKLCGKNQIERVMLASNRLGGLVPKTAPFKSAMPLKITDARTGKTRSIYEGVLQERIDFPLITMIERYTEENNPRKVNEFIDRIFDIQEKMWERGVFDIDPHFWRNYGFIDPGFQNLVCFDVGMLTDSLKISELIIRFFSSYKNYISSQLKGKMPEESIAYFEKKYKEIFTVSNLRRKWNTASPVSAWLDYYQDFDNSLKRNITRAAFSTAMNSPLRSADIAKAKFYVTHFLMENGLDENKELQAKLHEVIKDFFNTANSDIFRNKLQASVNQEIFMQIIALQKSTMFKPLMELVSKIMQNDTNVNRGVVLSLALQVAISEVALSNPVPKTSKTRRRISAYELIEQSL